MADFPGSIFLPWRSVTGQRSQFYGDFADLDAASLADVQSFFKTYYAPNNAVLLILGDVKPDEGLALAKKYFGDIPAGAPPPFADPREPEQTEERRGEVEEKFGTLPAMAIGYTVPPRRTSEWYAMTLLDQALHGGRAGRMYRHLVLEKQVAVEVDGGIDDVFGYNGPTQMVTKILHSPSTPATLRLPSLIPLFVTSSKTAFCKMNSTSSKSNSAPTIIRLWKAAAAACLAMDSCISSPASRYSTMSRTRQQHP